MSNHPEGGPNSDPVSPAPDAEKVKNPMSRQDRFYIVIAIAFLTVFAVYSSFLAKNSGVRDLLSREARVRTVCSSQAKWETAKLQLHDLGASYNDQDPMQPIINLESGRRLRVFVDPETGKVQGCVRFSE